jgi:hypothetical protein
MRHYGKSSRWWVVGGKWLGLRLSASSPHGRNQPIQHATHPGNTLLNPLVIGEFAIAKTKRYFELNLHFSL